MFPEIFLGIKYDSEKSELLKMWSELAKSCNWWHPYENFCFVSDRPESLHFDPMWRLHSEDRPAVKFRDGWSLWFWHGTEVSQKLIETPEKITYEDIAKEQNAEVRRATFEKLGAERFAELFELELIDEDVEASLVPGRGEVLHPIKLLRSKFTDPDIGRISFVEFTCPSSGRKYPLCPVDQETNNVWQAAASMHGETEKEYRNTIFHT